MKEQVDVIYELAHDLNPWWRQPSARATREFHHHRSLFEPLWNRLLDPSVRRALVVVGPRQVGKSTLLQQIGGALLDREICAPADLIYFDFSEDRCPPRTTVRDVVDLKVAPSDAPRQRFVLLDEITRAPDWSRALKSLVDSSRLMPPEHAPRYLVTDSSASILRTGEASNLQGRVAEYSISGLSFREFLDFNSRPSAESAEDVLQRIPVAGDLYLSVGGFPEHARAGLEAPERLREIRREIAKDLVNLAISRDLAEQTKDIERVRGLFASLAGSAGAEFEATKLARKLDQAIQGTGTDARTIQKWVRLLCDACLLFVLERRVAPTAQRASGAVRLGSHPKVYPEEHGLIAALSPFSNPMARAEIRAMALETAVLRHLRNEAIGDPPANLSYFRTKDGSHEIDFVLDFAESSVGIEVTSGSDPSKKLLALVKAGAKAGIERLLLVHGGTEHGEREGVVLVPFPEFLLRPRPYLDIPS